MCYCTGKAEKSKGATAPFGYTVVAATVGVPQAMVVRLVDSGGKYVTKVAGAVPNVVPEVAVPPEIGSVPATGGTLVSFALQSVVITNCVELVALAMVC